MEVSCNDLKDRIRGFYLECKDNEDIPKFEYLNKTHEHFYLQWVLKEKRYLIEAINPEINRPYIAIKDNNVYQGKTDETHLNRLNIVNNEANIKEPIIFRTHHESDKEFDAFYNEHREIYDNALFIEGISGHNTTDRLIRNETYNEIWALKITEAALTNVLVIDERIFQRLDGESSLSYYINTAKVDFYKLKEILDSDDKSIVKKMKTNEFIENNSLIKEKEQKPLNSAVYD